MQLQRDRLWAQNHQFGCVIFDSSKLLIFTLESLKNWIAFSGRHSSFRNCNFYLNRPWCRPDSAIWVSLQNCIFKIKNYKIYYYLSPHWYFMSQQTVSARRTTGICIGLRYIDSSIQIPYLVYTLKVIVINKITKTFCHPRKPATTTLCQEYLKLHRTVLHRITRASILA